MNTLPIRDEKGATIGTATLVDHGWLIEIGSDLICVKDAKGLKSLDSRCRDRRLHAALEQMKQVMAERGSYDSVVKGAEKFGKWMTSVVHPEDMATHAPAIQALSKGAVSYAPLFVMAAFLLLRNPSRVRQFLFR